MTPLHEAAWNDRVSCIDVLLRFRPAEINLNQQTTVSVCGEKGVRDMSQLTLLLLFLLLLLRMSLSSRW
jgi:hypothetical protein